MTVRVITNGKVLSFGSSGDTEKSVSVKSGFTVLDVRFQSKVPVSSRPATTGNVTSTEKVAMVAADAGALNHAQRLAATRTGPEFHRQSPNNPLHTDGTVIRPTEYPLGVAKACTILHRTRHVRLWVTSRHFSARWRRPLNPPKPTFVGPVKSGLLCRGDLDFIPIVIMVQRLA